MSTLYNRIIELCEKNNIKPGRMCVEAGISKSIISRLKQDGNGTITLEVAIKIAHYFGITVSELIDEKNPAAISDSEALEFGKLISQLSPEKKAALKAFLQS